MIYEEEEDELVDQAGSEQTASRDVGAGTIALAVLAGAAIGAAVALMLAPQSGREMRRVLSKRAGGLRDTAGSALGGASDEISRQLRRRSRQLRRKLDRMA
ncbi:MAG TPA: YtxH domain-containing protein [Gemmatimonadaceae bacterium]|nr:YtxH domain-containing protein [Gemmatimonadaceae bacterium]